MASSQVRVPVLLMSLYVTFAKSSWRWWNLEPTKNPALQLKNLTLICSFSWQVQLASVHWLCEKNIVPLESSSYTRQTCNLYPLLFLLFFIWGQSTCLAFFWFLYRRLCWLIIKGFKSVIPRKRQPIITDKHTMSWTHLSVNKIIQFARLGRRRIP